MTGEDVELLWVKGSGGDLGTLTEAGLATLRLDRVEALLRRLMAIDRITKSPDVHEVGRG